VGSDVDFDDNNIKGYVRQLVADAYGNGQPGLFAQLRTYLAVQEDREKQALRSQTRRDVKLNILIAIASIAVTLAGLILYHNHGTNSSLRTSAPVITAQYNSGVAYH